MAESNELAIRGQELTPQNVVELATEQSKLLMKIVEQTKCYQVISGKKYLQVEAWETIGAFNRTHAETDCVEPVLKDNETIGYRAHVQLFKDGVIVGGAWMPCYFTENCCKGKEGDAKHKAAMSAAQTFATSKAYRMNFSYIAILAGFQPLPAEEITEDMKESTNQDKEHWCSEHNTAFFMRGKMKAFAHPIGDTGEWCHEHKEKSEPKSESEPTPEVKPELPATEKTAKPEDIPDLTTLEFKNLGEFYTACHKHFGLTKSEVEKEIPEYDLTKSEQRKKAWSVLVEVYSKPVP